MDLDDAKVTIWQQNVNKSPNCQHDLISNNLLLNMGINIVALQEPLVNFLNLTVASKSWTPIYPSTHATSPDKTRSLMLISTSLSTDSWEQVNFPSGDVTVIQIKSRGGNLRLYNIYNDGKSNETIRLLTSGHNGRDHAPDPPGGNTLHTIWLGDFNRHHPYWDDPNDTRLFTNDALENAEILIEAVADTGLELVLPSGTPTHIHNVTKKWTRLDQVFLSDHSLDMLIKCDTKPDFRGIKTDHLPICTELNLNTPKARTEAILNFHKVDWDEFREDLGKRLRNLDNTAPIQNQQQLDKSCKELTTAIQQAINATVPTSEICDRSKR